MNGNEAIVIMVLIWLWWLQSMNRPQSGPMLQAKEPELIGLKDIVFNRGDFLYADKYGIDGEGIVTVCLQSSDGTMSRVSARPVSNEEWAQFKDDLDLASDVE